MKAFAAAAKCYKKQQSTIAATYLPCGEGRWEDAAECGHGPSKSTIVNIFEPSCGRYRKWVCEFWRKSVGSQKFKNVLYVCRIWYEFHVQVSK